MFHSDCGLSKSQRTQIKIQSLSDSVQKFRPNLTVAWQSSGWTWLEMSCLLAALNCTCMNWVSVLLCIYFCANWPNRPYCQQCELLQCARSESFKGNMTLRAKISARIWETQNVIWTFLNIWKTSTLSMRIQDLPCLDKYFKLCNADLRSKYFLLQRENRAEPDETGVRMRTQSRLPGTILVCGLVRSTNHGFQSVN